MEYPLGAKLSKKDPRDIHLVTASVISDLPVIFSRRQEQSPVVLQRFGSCTGFTIKDLLEARFKRRTGVLPKLSGRYAYALIKQNDPIFSSEEGASLRTSIRTAIGIGACEDSLFPSNDNSQLWKDYIANVPEAANQNAGQYMLRGGYVTITSIQELKRAIFDHGEVPIVIPVYEDYLANDSGVIRQPTGQLIGYHELLAIGWDDSNQRIEIKNHWDLGWGNNGYGFMPYYYNGLRCFMESMSPVDNIDAGATSGAPVAIAYPTDNHFVTQPFGANFNDPDGQSHYPKYGLYGHEGIDFRAKSGSNCYAIDNGTVIFSGVKGVYGNCIIIQHSWGTSLYAHLSQFVAEEGANVLKRQLIALTGDSGDAAGQPHLHLGGKINGVKNLKFADWIDLTPYFEKGTRMLVFFQVKNTSTIWALIDGEWTGFSDMDAFNKYTDGRPHQIVLLDQAEFNKVKANPDVFKT